MEKEQQPNVENKQLNRRGFLGAGAAAIAGAAFLSASATAQSRSEIHAGKADHSVSKMSGANEDIARAAADSENPPETDRGDVPSFWYSFDIAHRRIQEGGWTSQVTQRDLPVSKEVAGVKMRLTAGSYRELHWHTADEWAYVTAGSVRITLMSPDGSIFIDDVPEGDIWFFPAGYPHSIQGLGPDGGEFLLVFDNAMFSEYETFLLSDWIAHTSDSILSKDLKLPANKIGNLPKEELYIFPGTVPGSLEADRAAVGGQAVTTKIPYTYHLKDVKPTRELAGGSVYVVDSTNFLASTNMAAAVVTLKPGAMREMHWHPNGSEWQYWVKGSGSMTLFNAGGKARTMSFKQNDVGYVPAVAGHVVRNTGDGDLVFLEIFHADRFLDFSLNNWIRLVPPLMAKEHLNLSDADLKLIPKEKQTIIK
jgi:oxalate decarboxylase